MSSNRAVESQEMAELKERLCQQKLRLKAGEPVSKEELQNLKTEIQQRKLAAKLAQVAQVENVEPVPLSRLREEVGALSKRAQALSESIGEPGKPGQPLTAREGRPAEFKEVPIDLLKNQIRREKVQAKQVGGRPALQTIDLLKRQIGVEKLWDKLDLLGAKWERWGGGVIDPAPHRTIYIEVRELQRDIGAMSQAFG